MEDTEQANGHDFGLLFDQSAIHSIPTRSHTENRFFFFIFKVHSLQMYCQKKKIMKLDVLWRVIAEEME